MDRKTAWTTEERIADLEAELTRLRAEQQHGVKEGWRVAARRDAAMPGPFTDWWDGVTFWSTPDSLVAHIEAEATAPLRAQLAEAGVLLRVFGGPLAGNWGEREGWYERRRTLLATISEREAQQ